VRGKRRWNHKRMPVAANPRSDGGADRTVLQRRKIGGWRHNSEQLLERRAAEASRAAIPNNPRITGSSMTAGTAMRRGIEELEPRSSIEATAIGRDGAA
jgi:hypothetical protein